MTRPTALAFAAFLSGAASLLPPQVARAQDPFEIQVYEYATVPKGLWNLETHVNFVARGTKTATGLVYPTERQGHLTFELTRGITEDFELAAYLVFARHSGGDVGELAGYRFRPRVKAPESWKWPVDVSLALELGFPDAHYEENSMTLEVRPIIEKKFGDWQFDLNPVLGRALRGPNSGDGWDFEPNARVAYSLTPKLDLSLEYYGATGDVGHWLPADQQIHQFFPGFDYQFSETMMMNFGFSIPGTKAGDQSVIKFRLGVLFGGK